MDIVLNNFPQVKEKVTKIAEGMKVEFDKQSDNGFVGFDVQKFDNEKKVLSIRPFCIYYQKVIFQLLGDFISSFRSSEGGCI